VRFKEIIEFARELKSSENYKKINLNFNSLKSREQLHIDYVATIYIYPRRTLFNTILLKLFKSENLQNIKIYIKI